MRTNALRKEIQSDLDKGLFLLVVASIGTTGVELLTQSKLQPCARSLTFSHTLMQHGREPQ